MIRRAAAVTAGRKPGAPGRPSNIRKWPAGGGVAGRASSGQPAVRPQKRARGLTVFVEICAGRRSKVVAAAAKRRGAAVHIVEPKPDEDLGPAPALVAGVANTWPLDIRKDDHQAVLLRWLRQVCRRTREPSKTRKHVRSVTALSSPPCKEWSKRNQANRWRRDQKELRLARATSIADVRFIRSVHKL